MARTLTIRIRSTGEAFEGFRRAFKRVEAGRLVSPREGIYFASIEAARNLLTPGRLALLRAVRAGRPGSIYELAKMVGRDLKNVQTDLGVLETYGLVRMARATRSGSGECVFPRQCSTRSS
jgi:predicted transcriptional regulator